MRKKLFLILGMLFTIGIVYAQQIFSLKVSGEMTNPLSLTMKDLAVMPHKTVTLNERDGKGYQYTGVPISVILLKAGVTVGSELRGDNLSKYLLVRCADGYEVLFSLAELDSSFTDREVILADSIEGQPIAAAKGPLRLVVAGEKKPARSCFQVVELVVGYSK